MAFVQAGFAACRMAHFTPVDGGSLVAPPHFDFFRGLLNRAGATLVWI